MRAPALVMTASLVACHRPASERPSCVDQPTAATRGIDFDTATVTPVCCPDSVRQEIPATLRYFGYFSSGQDATPGVARTLYQDGRHIMLDVASRTNLVWIVDNEVAKVRISRRLGLKAVLYVHRRFFRDEWEPIDPSAFVPAWRPSGADPFNRSSRDPGRPSARPTRRRRNRG